MPAPLTADPSQNQLLCAVTLVRSSPVPPKSFDTKSMQLTDSMSLPTAAFGGVMPPTNVVLPLCLTPLEVSSRLRRVVVPGIRAQSHTGKMAEYSSEVW